MVWSFISVLWILLLFNKINGEVIVVNHLADPIIEELRRVIVEEHKDRTSVDDIEEDYTVNLFKFNINLVRFECKNGWISDISTIIRKGDAKLITEESSVAIQLPFGFQTFKYECDSYFLKVPLIKFHGKLSADVGENVIDLKVSVEYVDDKCMFVIDHIIIQHLDGIKVSVTGFSIFNGLFDRIISRIAKLFKDAIKYQIMNEIKNTLIENMENLGLCHHNKTSY